MTAQPGTSERNDSAGPKIALPPSLWAWTPRAPFRQALRNARWLMAAYVLLLVSSNVALNVAVMMTEASLDSDDIQALVMFASTSLIGGIAGLLLGLLGLRAFLTHLLAFVTTIGGVWIVGEAKGNDPIIVAGIGLIIFFWALDCGLLASQARSTLISLWVPTLLFVGSIMMILNHSGAASTWRGGDKHAVWDLTTITLLVVFVVELLLFWAAQEQFHVSVWQSVVGGSEPAITRQGGDARLSLRGMLVILLFAVALVTSIALFSPYLWRTGEGGKEGSAQNDGGEKQDDVGKGGQQDSLPEKAKPKLDKDSIERAAQEAAKKMAWSLLLLLLLLLFAAGYRPAKRFVVLTLLRFPWDPDSPSDRAASLWRYVTVALGDAGMVSTPGESDHDVVRRYEELRVKAGEQPVPSLLEAVEAYQQIRFGFGISPGGLQRLESNVVVAFTEIRRPLSLWQRIRCWWRRLDG